MIEITTASEQSLRLLFISADPHGGTLLRHNYEQTDLEKALRSRAIEVDAEVETTREKLLSALEGPKPLILHISCHGRAEPEPALLLQDEHKNEDGVPPDDLVKLLTDCGVVDPGEPEVLSIDVDGGGLRLVVLSACNSSQHAEALAAAFPTLCVVGFAREVGQEHVRLFCRNLYRRLGSGRSIEQAVRKARHVLPEVVAQQVVTHGPGEFRLRPREGGIHTWVWRSVLSAAAMTCLAVFACVAYYGCVPSDPEIDRNILRPRIGVSLSVGDGELPLAVVTALEGTPVVCPAAPEGESAGFLCERRVIPSEVLKRRILEESIEGLNNAVPLFSFVERGGDTSNTMCLSLKPLIGHYRGVHAQRARLAAHTGPCGGGATGLVELYSFDASSPPLESGELARGVFANLRQERARRDSRTIRMLSDVPFSADFVADFTRDRVATELGIGNFRVQERRLLERGNSVFAVFLEGEDEVLFRACNHEKVAGPLTIDMSKSCQQLTRLGRHWPRAPVGKGKRIFLRSWRQG